MSYTDRDAAVEMGRQLAKVETMGLRGVDVQGLLAPPDLQRVRRSASSPLEYVAQCALLAAARQAGELAALRKLT